MGTETVWIRLERRILVSDDQGPLLPKVSPQIFWLNQWRGSRVWGSTGRWAEIGWPRVGGRANGAGYETLARRADKPTGPRARRPSFVTSHRAGGELVNQHPILGLDDVLILFLDWTFWFSGIRVRCHQLIMTDIIWTRLLIRTLVSAYRALFSTTIPYI